MFLSRNSLTCCNHPLNLSLATFRIYEMGVCLRRSGMKRAFDCSKTLAHTTYESTSCGLPSTKQWWGACSPGTPRSASKRTAGCFFLTVALFSQCVDRRFDACAAASHTLQLLPGWSLAI